MLFAHLKRILKLDRLATTRTTRPVTGSTSQRPEPRNSQS
jgi:hypothetical protein